MGDLSAVTNSRMALGLRSITEEVPGCHPTPPEQPRANRGRPTSKWMEMEL